MTGRSPASIAALIGVGLLLGGATVLAGFLVIGMGHGWDVPAQYGILALALYPLALLRWRAIDRGTSWRRDLAITALFVLAAAILAFRFDAVPGPPPVPAAGVILLAVPLVYAGVGWLLRASGLHVVWSDMLLLAIGLMLGVNAVADYRTDTWAGNEGWLLYPWLVLWIGWQAIALAALVRHLRSRAINA